MQRCGLCEIDIICLALGINGAEPFNLLRRSQSAQVLEA